MKIVFFNRIRWESRIGIWEILLCFALCYFVPCFGYAQNKTLKTLTGTVLDEQTGEPLPNAHILPLHGHSRKGVVTDANGKFKLKIDETVDSLLFTFTGYRSQTKAVPKRQNTSWEIRLKPVAVNLQGVEIKSSTARYRNKDNPAVALIRKAIEQKSSNRMESQSCYNYKQHEKMQIDLNAVEKPSPYIPMQNVLPYLFRQADTNRATGQVRAPVYLLEHLSATYYHKDKGGPRTVIEGTRDVEVSPMIDTRTFETMVGGIFGAVNIYDDNVALMNKKIMSPLHPLSPNFYKFFIMDTVLIGSDTCTELFFAPRNFRDMGFTGSLFLTNDGEYAVRKLDLKLTETVNLNYVEHFTVEQIFVKYDSVWVLTTDELNADFDFHGIYFHGRKKNIYAEYTFNQPLVDSYYGGVASTVRQPQYDQRSEVFWQERRLEPLTETEKRCYGIFEDLEKKESYRYSKHFFSSLISNYLQVGFVDFGPLGNSVSYNNWEGIRLRIGGKTNQKLSEHVFLDGFLAYGFGDQRLKYRTSLLFSFRKHKNHPWEFPMNLLSATYEYNSRILGQGLAYGEEDRLFLSIGRRNVTELIYENRLQLEWKFENQEGFLIQPQITYLQQRGFANAPFVMLSGIPLPVLITSEAGIHLRFAPGERFVQNQKFRMTISGPAPIAALTLKKTFPQIFGSNYSYTTVQLALKKQFFLSSFGQLETELNGGYLWGKAPYQSLFIPPANSNWAFQRHAFNTMNYLEFISDSFAETVLLYHMNGLLFNRMPLIKRWHWRELFGLRAIWGGLRQENNPNITSNTTLLPLPQNEHNGLLTQSLNKGPYMEYMVGIDNIFKLFQVCFVQRLSYLDHRNISPWTIRVNMHVAF